MNTAAITKNGRAHLPQKQGYAILQHEIVEILLNSERIQLNGFLPHKQDVEDLTPLTANLHVSDIDSPATSRLAVDASRERLDRRRRLGRYCFASALLTALVGLAFLLGQSLQAHPDAASGWRVVEVAPQGIVLELREAGASGDDPQRLSVPVGAVLPDGQRLLRVDVARQIYSTDVQDVRLRLAEAGGQS